MLEMVLLHQDNVIISSEGRALICDFGCSRMLLASRTVAQLTSTTKGTNQFWAPELISVADGEVKQSKETDVWAFGMTVYVCLFNCLISLL